MALISAHDFLTRAGLLATLAGVLSSCAPEPPAIVQVTAKPGLQTSLAPERRLEGPQSQVEDICAIYRSMFPASVIKPLKSMFDDARVSSRAEVSNETPAEALAIRAKLVADTGGERSIWREIPDDLLVRAFRSWRPGALPDCDWNGFARAVSAPVRNGQILPVLTSDETGSYQRVSKPFFIDRDTAIVLIHEVIDDGYQVKRRLVFTYRDGHGWAMLPHTFEEGAAPPQGLGERRD